MTKLKKFFGVGFTTCLKIVNFVPKIVRGNNPKPLSDVIKGEEGYAVKTHTRQPER